MLDSSEALHQDKRVIYPAAASNHGESPTIVERKVRVTGRGGGSTMNVVLIAALLSPAVAIIAALAGQIDLGTAVFCTILVISGGGASTATESGVTKSKRKGKPKT